MFTIKYWYICSFGRYLNSCCNVVKCFYNLSRQVFIHTTLEKLIAKQTEEVRLLFVEIKL